LKHYVHYTDLDVYALPAAASDSVHYMPLSEPSIL